MRANRLRGLVLHLVLLVGVVISIFPFYWMIVMATNNTSDIYQYPPKVAFGDELMTNLGHVFERINFFAAMGNTIVVASCVTLLVLFLDSLAAFTFAKFTFPGRRVLFALLIGIFTLPAQLSLIPQFVIMVKILGIYTFITAWNDYVWPLIVLVSPDRLTLQVALSQLNRSYGQDYSMVMAGALLAVLPLVVLFVLFARNFIADAVKGALRG
jgi:ABC-type glycerol-3-phosphate transport system permease component